MSYLIRVALKPEKVPQGADAERFPFSVRAIRTFAGLDLSAPVTFFVGENGSGKSTLLEAIAAAADLRHLRRSNLGNAIDASEDTSLEPQRALASALRLSWSPRTRDGFFLRAEDFFSFLRSEAFTEARVLREQREAALHIRSADADGFLDDHREAVKFMKELDSRSHGESFFDAFEDRVTTKGIYFLDEPETPLSPKRQIEFLRFLIDKSTQGAQFVIATHSPILLACPGAKIYSFDETPIRQGQYDQLAHVTVLREFLRDPLAYLETPS